MLEDESGQIKLIGKIPEVVSLLPGMAPQVNEDDNMNTGGKACGSCNLM